MYKGKRAFCVVASQFAAAAVGMQGEITRENLRVHKQASLLTYLFAFLLSLRAVVSRARQLKYERWGLHVQLSAYHTIK